MTYDWCAEHEKFGPLRPPMNRASDDADVDDLTNPDIRRAFLSERLKERAKIQEIKADIGGVSRLIQKREIALQVAKNRDNFDQEEFDASYPPYELPGFDVTVIDIEIILKVTLDNNGK